MTLDAYLKHCCHAGVLARDAVAMVGFSVPRCKRLSETFVLERYRHIIVSEAIHKAQAYARKHARKVAHD